MKKTTNEQSAPMNGDIHAGTSAYLVRLDILHLFFHRRFCAFEVIRQRQAHHSNGYFLTL